MYAPEKDALVWKIKNFPGGREFLLRCKFGLPSVAAEEESHGRLPPIKVKFEIPYYSVRRAGWWCWCWWCMFAAHPPSPACLPAPCPPASATPTPATAASRCGT